MKRVLFLLSDTGGGHRATAMAIQAAMQQRYPNHYSYKMVDVFKEYTPFPFKHMPELYPYWVTKSSFTWGLGFMLINGPKRWRNLLRLAFYLSWRRGIHRLFQENEADVVVSVHSLFNHAGMKVLKHYAPERPPFVTVVTDLVSTPFSWYHPDVDLCLVPTPEAYQRGLRMKMRPGQLRLTGLPVHPSFVEGVPDKLTARQELGWEPHRLSVLFVSGGDAMGPVFEMTRAIDAACLDIQFAIVAGRNQPLERQLNKCSWNQPTYIYPFVNMASLMPAADILITKAGPSTIAEASVMGLPMIISGKIPGQENGNVTWVTRSGAGVYAPTPSAVVECLRQWTQGDPNVLEAYSAAAHQLAYPDAAWAVAEEIHQLVQNREVHQNRATLPSWSALLPHVRPQVNRPPHSLL